MKYYLDLSYNDRFELKTIEDHNTICEGNLKDLGIQENDPDYSNKLDDYFEKEYGILPTEWEIG